PPLTAGATLPIPLPLPELADGSSYNAPPYSRSESESTMSRTVPLVAATLVSSAVLAQDGPLRRAGQALDTAGKNIRYRVETEIARGQVALQDREILHRVARRIEWDKQFLGSTLRIEVRPVGTVVLQGSVLSEAVRRRAVDVAENTIGVT